MTRRELIALVGEHSGFVAGWGGCATIDDQDQRSNDRMVGHGLSNNVSQFTRGVSRWSDGCRLC